VFIYRITFDDGSIMQMRANSPKQVNELASKIGIVSAIKFLR
jgi:hypothetical protein